MTLVKKSFHERCSLKLSELDVKRLKRGNEKGQSRKQNANCEDNKSFNDTQKEGKMVN